MARHRATGTAQPMDDDTPRTPLAQALVEHLDRLHGYLLVLGADKGQAEEVIQELALSVADAGDEQPDNALAWLLVAARRRFVDLLRRGTVRRQRELPVDGLLLAVEEALAEEPEEDAMDDTDVDALRRCLGRLAPRARELIDLRYWGNLPSADIAKRLGWGDAAVRVALSKARRALETCMNRTRPQGTAHG